MRFLITVCSLAAVFFLYADLQSGAEDLSTQSEQYWPSSTCNECHVKIFDQHLKSMHARSFDDPVPAGPVSGMTGYDVTGFRMSDAETLGNDIAKGMRIYRSIFADSKDRPTLSSYNAVNIIFDNRIDACEVREENYEFFIPEDAGKSMSVEARLYYMPYPVSFAEQLELPKPEAFVISSTTGKLDLK